MVFKKGSIPWNKGLKNCRNGYRHSEETLRKIGEGNKGKVMSKEARLKMSLSKKGKKHPPFSKEHRLNLSKSLLGNKNCLGRVLSEETRRKIGDKNKIKNKGRHFSPQTEFKKGHIISEDSKKKLILASTGRRFSEEQKIKMRKPKPYGFSIKLSNINKGKKLSEETKNKIRIAHLGKNLSDKHRDSMKTTWNDNNHLQYARMRRINQTLPVKDTSIEIKIQSFLKQLEIEFTTHQYVKEIEHGYQCDIMIPVQKGVSKKTIIECFGNYWHRPYPIGREVDIQRCKELRANGWRVIVFWECEIRPMELDNLQEVVLR